ncbi:Flagellar hook-associated protein 3 [Posidoniimonas corsicana]|uniref:Flagellar hook-associated protein 3 n=1 Tax=Posidoniimonas corsicana TaxID=1938618 RepID=A0A5C5VJN0_9BACT|nr:flagellar hook-associated protein FlgL [Posidoniimonas corsicana]TWT37922.1 Flagellar hook-associated protein 3 [Posidoniimonas corsicana]
MAAIFPIPTTRTSDYLARTRLVQQIQSDQVDLIRLQTQLSTGRRIFLPSDDPGAAVRAITLQRTLERKGQLQTNISSAANKLTVAEGSLTQVSDVINNVRGSTLAVVDTISTDEQRQAVLKEVNEALDSLAHFANSQYQDTYLFGGSLALQPPFVNAGNYIEYRGNEANLQSHVEIGRLFDTNISGDEIFGGLSEAVRGSVDLDLQASEGTYLSQLNGGQGVSPNGAVELVIGLNRYVVDLSAAHTLGDAARLIEEGAPAGSGITVDVQGDGLRVNPGPGGLAIREVSGGRTASELGIRQDTQTLTSFGDDVNPSLRKTSRLSDLGGTKATARISLGAANTSIKLRATANGADFNGLDLNVVDGATPGAESAAYTAGPPPSLTITVAEDSTTTQDVIDLINADAAVPFEASIDFFGADPPDQAGQGLVALQSQTSITSGGAGSALDLSAGLRITNGEGEVTVDTSGAQTIEDLVDILNQPEFGLSAQINDTADGIDVRSRRSGADFAIGENGGTLAEDLGIRTYTYTSRLDGFNGGRGVIQKGVNDTETRSLNDFTITVRDQGVTTTYEIDPIGLSTVQDLIDRIAAPVSQGGTGGAVVATLAATGNGLVLSRADAVDAATPATVDVAYAGDTLTFTADSAGPLGNDDFTLQVIDSGSGGLSSTYDPNADPKTIVVDLGGSASETTATIAAEVSAAVGGYSVTAADGTQPAATVAPTAVAVAGGFDADEFTVSGSLAGRLGFLPEGQGTVTSTGASVTAEDRNPQAVESVFNTLIRLRDALKDNDTISIGEAFADLDEDLNRATFARSEVGARLQNLDVLEVRLEDEEVQLRSSLSDAIDADIAEVISDFTARQFSLQASLQTTANLLQLSVLNFL